MSTRIKRKCISNVTLEQAQEAGRTLAEKQNRLDRLKAEMNEKVNTIKSRYSDEITQLNEALDEPTKILEIYAYEQRSSWGKRKSIELVHCEVGFRTCPPRVTKEKQFTWEAVLELLKKTKVFKPFIRIKEEINKEAILSLNPLNAKESKMLEQLHEQCYLFVDQEDAFFVQVKEEDVVV